MTTARHVIRTDDAPAPVAPYNQAVAAAGLVFASGNVGVDRATGSLVAGGAGAETERAVHNLGLILDAAGSGLDRVLKTTVFLVDMADYAAMNEVYRTAFPEPYPARTTVAVAALPLGARVEIECVALGPDGS